MENTLIDKQQQIDELFDKQRAFYAKGDTKIPEYRKYHLNKMYETIKKYEKEISKALFDDLHKSEYEAYITEVGLVKKEIKHQLSLIDKYSKPCRVSSSIFVLNSKSEIYYEPYGLTLIVSPWNYPFHLALMPLVGAVAAGNCAILKLSPDAKATNRVIKKIIESVFDKEYVKMVRKKNKYQKFVYETNYAFTKNGIAILPSNKRIAYTFNSINISDTEKAKEELLKTTLDGDKLVKVVFCKTEKENLICFTVNHFLIDLISWEILMKDFTVVVNQLRNNKEVFIPAKSASFKLWNEELVKYTELNENKKYWESVLPRLDDTQSLNIQEEKNEAEEFTFTFSKDISDKLVNEVNKMYGTRVNEILVTALGLAAGKLAGGSVGIMVESHGRTALNTRIAIERTVGWFTSCYPVIVNNSENIAEEIINTKETIRKIPRNGIEYLVLSDGFHKNSDIIFNFYKNSISNESRENKLVAFGGTSIFPGKINVNCFVADNILSLGISVPKCKHKPGISEELGSEFIAQIHKIVDYCTATDTVIKTRSDFSDDTLTQSELDELMELFD